MNSGVLMIVLTLVDGGGMSAAFVNTASVEECERRGRGVNAILTSQKVSIEALVCRDSEARFEAFTHGGTSAQTHTYLVTFNDRRAWIARQPDGATCARGTLATDAPPNTTRYCATSTQKLLTDGN